MKKLLSIIVLGLLLSGNAYSKSVKKGSGPLKLSENTIEIFYTYLTQKLSYGPGPRPNHKGKVLPGFHGAIIGEGSVDRPAYGDYFLIRYDKQPYIWVWGSSVNQNPGSYLKVFGMGDPTDYKIFAKKNKIVWKGAKKKISRKVSLDELKNILTELGFYN